MINNILVMNTSMMETKSMMMNKSLMMTRMRIFIENIRKFSMDAFQLLNKNRRIYWCLYKE